MKNTAFDVNYIRETLAESGIDLPTEGSIDAFCWFAEAIREKTLEEVLEAVRILQIPE